MNVLREQTGVLRLVQTLTEAIPAPVTLVMNSQAIVMIVMVRPWHCIVGQCIHVVIFLVCRHR